MKTKILFTICLMLFGAIALQAQNLKSFFDNKSGKYGFKDETGKIIIPAKYGNFKEFFEGYARVSLGGFTGGLWGCIDKSGKEIVPFKYDEIGLFDYKTNLAKVKLNGKYGFVNKAGKEIVQLKYDWIDNFLNGYAVVNIGGEEDKEWGGFTNGKWGLIDTTGKEIVPVKYDWINPVLKNDKIEVKQNGRTFFIDKTGKETGATQQTTTNTLITPIDNLTPFQDTNGKYGFKDKAGKIVRQPNFFYAAKFSEGLSNVGLGKTADDVKFGYIDATGKIVIPFIYFETADFSEGLAGVLREDGKWGFIDKTGKEVIPFIYENAYGFKNGKAKVQKDGREFYIDKTGKETGAIQQTIKTPITSIGKLTPFKDGNGRFGYKDNSGTTIIRPVYNKAQNFSEGLAAVYIEKEGKGLWGFIDEKGKMIIPFKYADVGDFSEGLAVVIEGFYLDKLNQWGAIDKTGKVIIPLKYNNLTDFKDGKAKAELNGREFFIDKTDKEIK
ncbi:MAG: WG repeat-containing protein [Chitinophagales bacterium]